MTSPASAQVAPHSGPASFGFSALDFCGGFVHGVLGTSGEDIADAIGQGWAPHDMDWYQAGRGTGAAVGVVADAFAIVGGAALVWGSVTGGVVLALPSGGTVAIPAAAGVAGGLAAAGTGTAMMPRHNDVLSDVLTYPRRQGAPPRALPPPRYTPRSFASEALYNSHFEKHAAEWGVGNVTRTLYLRRARDLLSRNVGGDILGHTRANGDVMRYNVRTNEFAVGASDGTVRTLFRPRNGRAYWEAQVAHP